MKIMVCADGAKSSEKAIDVAAQYAKISSSSLMILHVIESEVRRNASEYDSYGEKQKQAQAIIDDALEIAAGVASGLAVSTRIAAGPISAEIVRIAEAEGFGAIFVGSGGSSKIKKMLLGSVTDDVIHYAHCPVTVVR